MAGIKIFGVIVVLFIISLVQSCTEIRLSLGGKQDKATVQEILVEVKRDSGAETGKFLVRYFYHAQDGDGPREYTGQYTTNRAEAEIRQKGDKLDLLYLAGKPSTHRIVGHRQRFWIFILIALTMGGAGYVVWWYRQP